MRKKLKLVWFLQIITFLFATSAFAVTWGSFDATRINYPIGPLTGSAHDTLRGIILNNGDAIGSATGTLTSGYLSGVDVFYTSLLSTSTGTLSGVEQTALQSWIASGGTLIVTADIFSLAAYDSFTSAYGVTNYTFLSHVAFGSPTAAHMITQNVSSYNYATESTFTYGSDALLLGDNGYGDPFMVVLEPATGFSAGGRILVIGDHNMFTENYISNADNSILAANIVDWAAVPEPATMLLLGSGLIGMMGFKKRRKE